MTRQQQAASRPESAKPRWAACTVTSMRGLPATQLVVESFLRHHPGQQVVVLVTDGQPEAYSGAARAVGVDWLGIDETEFLRMATSYDEAALADVLAPSLLARVLAEHDVAIYLDHRGQVHGSLEPLATAATAHDIALVPKLLEPLPVDASEPDEDALAASGPFDLGIIACGPGAKEFLAYWADRLQRAGGRGWVATIPTLFRHHIVRDPGIGLSYVNAHERPLTRDADGTLRAAGQPLRHVHLPGFDPDAPWLLTADVETPRSRLSDHPELRGLSQAYGDDLLKAGWREAQSRPYGFAQMPDGTPLTPVLRERFHAEWQAARNPDATTRHRRPTELPPHPFGADGGSAFRSWVRTAASPVEAAAGLNRLVMGLWRARIDLQVAFPSPTGANGDAFRHWCRTHGLDEGLPSWALPADPAPPEPPVDEFGVNVAGYLTADLGLGQMGRIVHDVVEAAGIPVASVTDGHSVQCATPLDEPSTAGRPRYPVSLLAVNSDFTEVLLAGNPELGHERYRIGLWAWELADFPPRMHSGFAHLDEIWTVSEFTRAAIAPHSPVPVKTFPVPVSDPGAMPQRTREPGDDVRFLFAFDFNSTGQRKNPWGLVHAFKQAFADRRDARLVLKMSNARLHPAAAERLRHAVGGDERIEVIEQYLTEDELDGLYADCDAYVSLHRSEGFGLTIAEAMIRGVPVIATDYSGSAEFFDDQVGWAVPYELTEVGEGWPPYQPDGVWAEPDLDIAARAMRTVADNPAEARRRGAAARERLLRERSVNASAAWVREQLHAAYDTWRSRAAVPDGPTAPLSQAEEAVHRRADPAAASRNPLAPALRRAVLRTLDHYDSHQRAVHGEMVDGVREAIEALAAQGDARDLTQDQAIAELSARLDALERQMRE